MIDKNNTTDNSEQYIYSQNVINIQLDLAIKLSETNDLKSGLDACLKAAMQVSEMDSGGIYLFDDDTGEMKLIVHSGLSEDFINDSIQYSADSPNALLVLKGQPTYMQYHKMNLKLSEAKKKEKLKAVAIIPIKYNDKIIACMNIASHNLEEVPEFSRKILEIIGSQVGNAIARLKTEEKLRISEEKYRMLFENIPSIIFTMDRKGLITSVNRAVKDLFGFEPDFLIGKSYKTVLSKDVGEISEKQFQEILNGAEVKNTNKIVAMDGSEKYVDYHSKPFYSGDSIIGIQGIARDITAKIKAEQDLKQQRDFAESLIETAQVIILVLDTKGQIVRFNPYMEKISGYKLDEVIGKNWLSCFLPKKDHHKLNEIFIDTIKGNMHNGNINPIITKQGKEISIEWYSKLLLNSEEKIIGILSIGQDITERIKAHEELLKAQRLEALGILAGGIAHDFNNLLGGLFGYIDLALYEANDNKQLSEYLHGAMSAYSRAKDLTEQLLTFSKGGIPKKKQLNITHVLTQTIHLILSGSSISHNLHIPNGLWLVEADEGQLSQVFSNILLNARQAMSTGGKINISVENVRLENDQLPELAAGYYIMICISDEGVGIPAHLLSKIFDPFFTTKAIGSGLGLATSYSIVKKHGGNIQIESEKNQGTAVSVWLPAINNCKTTESDEPAKIPALKGNILIMDDEYLILDIASRMLKKLGFIIEIAKNGQEAIIKYKNALLHNKKFDAVILDLTVSGGMGGEEAVKRLREIDPDIIAIASSGYSDSPIIAEPEKFGFNGMISKPYKLIELAQVLRKIVNPM